MLVERHHANLTGKMDDGSGVQPSRLLPFQESDAGSRRPRKLSPDLLSLINAKFHFQSPLALANGKRIAVLVLVAIKAVFSI